MALTFQNCKYTQALTVQNFALYVYVNTLGR
jgi:hypothetical protein